jgi:hypothetical protein
MKILANHRLTQPQIDALAMTEMVLNSAEFQAWFIRTPLSELGEMADRNNLVILEKYFRDKQYRFNWKIVKRPFYKVFSKALGMTSGDTITTYEQIFNKMSAEDRAAHFAHEMMHIVGFEHSEKASPSRDKSVPYKVGDFVRAVVAHFKKANE